MYLIIHYIKSSPLKLCLKYLNDLHTYKVQQPNCLSFPHLGNLASAVDCHYADDYYGDQTLGVEGPCQVRVIQYQDQEDQ